MINIVGTERPEYISNNIGIFVKNKIGEYSKFLNMNPIFITYYAVNKVMSTQDVGTGSIESEIGIRSPIRFNKICNFPIYNVPELKPDIQYDESGYDIELECSDLVCLPNTLVPSPGDHFIISFPGIKEFLFRVNSFKYNTIQSNDYYTFDADIRQIGVDMQSVIAPQVVDEFYTVFENIGTEDRCFIRSSDVDYVNNLATTYDRLRDWYKNAFYIRELNSFTYQTGRWSETGRPIYRYDAYLERFINRAKIYYTSNKEDTIICTPADILQDKFDFVFEQTIYDAILKRNVDFLKTYCYIVTSVIMKQYSPYNVMHYFGESTSLFCYNKRPKRRPTDIIVDDNTCPCCCIPPKDTGEEIWHPLDPPNCTPTWSLSDGIEYFPSSFLRVLKLDKIDTDDYFEVIIFNYLKHISMEYDKREIYDLLEINEHCFYYLPLVIYILGATYKEYFVSEKELNGSNKCSKI